MKKSFAKRFIAIALAIFMVVSVVPLAVATDGKTYYRGDHIEFGNYPQSLVSDALTIEKLNRKEKEWISYDYAVQADDPEHGNMKVGNYMKYADITYKNCKYRAVTFSEYRMNSDQSNSRFKKNEIYYFKFEPLSWRVLDPNEGLVMCEYIIDSQPLQNSYYYDGSVYWHDDDKDYYASNYAESSIREWLNDSFFNTAFSEAQKEIVHGSVIDNTSNESAFSSRQSIDNVFLLSYSELTNEDYGFYSRGWDATSSRSTRGTDYAHCQGLSNPYMPTGDSGRNTVWMTRTATSSGGVYTVSGFYYHVDYTLQEPGGRMRTGSALYAGNGIRPACYLYELKNDTEQHNLDIYDLGDDTYSFGNFDNDSCIGAHCLGMAATSSMYYLGLLDINSLGGGKGKKLHDFKLTEAVRKPICYYSKHQGHYVSSSVVAGGSFEKHNLTYVLENTDFSAWTKNWILDIKSDWDQVTSYLNDHSFDNEGSLFISYRNKFGKGHAINFLYYAVEEGQERIYVYDNNIPGYKTYFYKDSDGNVYQAPLATFKKSDKITPAPIGSIALCDVNKFYKQSLKYKEKYALYSKLATLSEYPSVFPVNTNASIMLGDYTTDAAQVMYEIPEDATEVKIIPKEDNASFVYMDKEYSFGKIDEDTYGILKLSTTDEVEMNDAKLIVENAPEIEHTHEYTSAVTTAPTCTIDGETTYTCSVCGDTYTEPIPATGNHVDDNNDGKCDTCGEKMTGGKHCKYCGKIHGGAFGWLVKFFHSIFAIFKR